MTVAHGYDLEEAMLDNIANSLVQCGYIVLPNALDKPFMQDLYQYSRSLPSTAWQEAGISRGRDHQIVKSIRSDKTCWLSSNHPIEKKFNSYLESLRKGLNKRLFMGLFDHECHFSTYESGSYYKKHIDALKGKTNRILSMVLYLNADWQQDDGGELILYLPERKQEVIQRVLPQMGTAVLFLSEKFPHEVLKTNRQRFSLVAWFRVAESQFLVNPIPYIAPLPFSA
tara:strand:- start:114686 stop:115366 length:681 start_codon:yes stop_codon:yes gene_type:complete